MKLLIKVLSEETKKLYLNHGHFHQGDAGFDLYTPKKTTFQPGETKAIKFEIACESENGQAYYLFPRSSISKHHYECQIP